MNELQQYIQSYFGVPNEALSELANLFVPTTLKRGDFHTKSDSYHSNLSFLSHGFIRIYAIYEGKEITQWISTPGEFVTDLSCARFDLPARWDIQAITDCELYTISADNYRKIGSLIPGWEKCRISSLRPPAIESASMVPSA